MDEFVRHALELMAPWATVTARRMFGGHGLYRDGRMFALVADGTLYFKADVDTAPQFAAAGSAPFVYQGGGRRVTMSYWRAPDSCLDDSTGMQTWCALAWTAATRAPAPVRRRRPR
jgi:DNA transformation protein